MKMLLKSKKTFAFGLVFLIIFGCALGLMANSNKYTTPEKTWETYTESIIKGDLEAALDCIAEYKKDFERKRHYDKVIDVKGMQKRIKPIKSIELVRSGISDQHGLHAPREYKLYRIATEKGHDDKWTIFFIKINGEWKIESLPF